MRSISKKITHYKRGIFAEYYAAIFLRLKGYRILSMRFKTKVGEIDIIAKKADIIVFVEVKFRPDEGQALSAVIPNAQKRIRRAADYFLLSQKGRESLTLDPTIRFDVIGITENFKIRHITNAF